MIWKKKADRQAIFVNRILQEEGLVSFTNLSRKEKVRLVGIGVKAMEEEDVTAIGKKKIQKSQIKKS